MNEYYMLCVGGMMVCYLAVLGIGAAVYGVGCLVWRIATMGGGESDA